MRPTAPSAGVNGVIRAVLVDSGAEAGRAELEGIVNKLLIASNTQSTPCQISAMIRPGWRSGVGVEEFFLHSRWTVGRSRTFLGVSSVELARLQNPSR